MVTYWTLVLDSVGWPVLFVLASSYCVAGVYSYIIVLGPTSPVDTAYVVKSLIVLTLCLLQPLTARPFADHW